MNAIQTETTCGPNCWYAKELACRCSCGGANHGILLEVGTAQPQRQSRIAGYMYYLAEVGYYQDIRKSARMWNLSQGFEHIGDSVELAYSLDPKKKTYRYHSHWYGNEIGCPSRVKKASAIQLKSWPELTAYRDMDEVYLLWVRVEMPEGDICYDDCPTCDDLCKQLKIWRTKL